jgi:hypothetical protein
MKWLLAALFVLASAAAAFAQLPVVGPQWTKVVHGSGTITSGTHAQFVTPTLSGPNRVFCVQNPGAATEDLFVADDVSGSTTPDASSTHGWDLIAGEGVCMPWQGAISVEAATTSHAFLTDEIQY